jgi:hypothetical protein
VAAVEEYSNKVKKGAIKAIRMVIRSPLTEGVLIVLIFSLRRNNNE